MIRFVLAGSLQQYKHCLMNTKLTTLSWKQFLVVCSTVQCVTAVVLNCHAFFFHISLVRRQTCPWFSRSPPPAPPSSTSCPLALTLLLTSTSLLTLCSSPRKFVPSLWAKARSGPRGCLGTLSQSFCLTLEKSHCKSLSHRTRPFSFVSLRMATSVRIVFSFSDRGQGQCY